MNVREIEREHKMNLLKIVGIQWAERGMGGNLPSGAEARVVGGGGLRTG